MRLDLAMHDAEQVILALRTEFPELAEDEVLRADTLEGCDTVDDVFRYIATSIREAQELAEAQARLAATYKERQARFEKREETLRTLAQRLLNRADLAKWQTPEGTFSLIAGKPKVEVVAPDLLPDDCVKIKREPDKAALKAKLESDMFVPGARLTNGAPSLRFA